MSSTERAPEPTMEEILSSIRRIITDDEAGQATAQDAAPKAQAEDESLEGEADNQIIDDIARVLSGDSDQAPANEEEEILDLAAELGGLEIVEDDGPAAEVAAVPEAAEVVEVLELEEIEFVEEAVPAPPVAEQSAPEPELTLSPDEPEILQPTAMEAVEAAPEVPQTAPEAVQHEPAQAAGEEAASALERAIAALRAGQPPASTTPQAEPFEFQTTPQADSMEAAEAAPEAGSEPEPVPMAIPMPSPEVEAETHPELDASLEVPGDVDFESQPDEAPVAPMLDEAPEELVLADAELTVIEETVVEAVGEPEVKGPFWPEQAEAEEPVPEAESVLSPEPEPVTAQVNGAEVHHDIEGKTMEDSVKDMLRPMLRQWLDDNMERLIREGFDPETLRRPQD